MEAGPEKKRVEPKWENGRGLDALVVRLDLKTESRGRAGAWEAGRPGMELGSPGTERGRGVGSGRPDSGCGLSSQTAEIALTQLSNKENRAGILTLPLCATLSRSPPHLASVFYSV